MRRVPQKRVSSRSYLRVWTSSGRHPAGLPMTLGNMRELGVRANERFPAPNDSKWSGFSIGLLRRM